MTFPHVSICKTDFLQMNHLYNKMYVMLQMNDYAAE